MTAGRQYLELEAVKLGTERQQALYRDGELPEEEILTIARAVLFKGFGAFERWSLSHEKPKMARLIRHVVGCDPDRREYAHEVHGPIPYEGTLDTTDVEERNLAALRAMADAAALHPWLVQTGGTVTVTAYTHWFSCMTCDGDIPRVSAKVTVDWGGRELVREYAL